MIIGYTVLEIWRVTDVILDFHFGQNFALLPPKKTKKEKLKKIKKKKKKKKRLEISSFYTIVPKLMIIGYTVPEIWCVTYVIVIFHFG